MSLTASILQGADLLLWCARHGTVEQKAALPSGAIVDEAVVEAAEFHGLDGLLFTTLERSPDVVVPDALRRRLAQNYRESSVRNLWLTTTLADLARRFDEAGIPMMALKGPTLAALLYDDAALRQSDDLDVLVRPADVERALAVLSDAGYALPPYLARLPLPRLLARDCETVLHRPKSVPVDLHWAVATNDYPFAFDAEVLWRTARTLVLAGTAVQVPSPEALLFYLCVHATKHGWSRLHWLMDLERLTNSELRHDEVVIMADQTRCARPLLVGLSLAHRHFDARVPLNQIERAHRDATVSDCVRTTEARLRTLPPSNLSSWARTAYSAGLAENWRAGLRHWSEMFKAPKDADLQRWALPAALFPLYYPLRLLRLIETAAGRSSQRPRA